MKEKKNSGPKLMHGTELSRHVPKTELGKKYGTKTEGKDNSRNAPETKLVPKNVKRNGNFEKIPFGGSFSKTVLNAATTNYFTKSNPFSNNTSNQHSSNKNSNHNYSYYGNLNNHGEVNGNSNFYETNLRYNNNPQACNNPDSVYGSWSGSGSVGPCSNSTKSRSKKERGRANAFTFVNSAGSDDDISLASSLASFYQAQDSQNYNGTDSTSASCFTGSNNDIAQLGESEINEKFESMLDDMNLSEERKAPLRNRDMKMKREMLSMHLRGVSHKGAVKAAGPIDYIKFLSHYETTPSKLLRWLESLRVALKSNPVSWVREFGIGGLNGLLGNLAASYDRSPNDIYVKIQHECIRCLKAFMNNKYGLTAVMQHPDALILMAKSVDPRHPNIMNDTVKIMAAFCLIPPDGHSKVLQALTICWDDNNTDRFQPIIMALQINNHLNLQVSCIQFINAIVSTPEDLDFRLHLRNEFFRCGLTAVLESLTGSLPDLTPPDLRLQLDVFSEQRDEDKDELSHRYDEVKFEFEDADDCYRALKRSFVRQPAIENSFLAILQYLLCLKEDDAIKPAYYKLIETCVSQIVLHKNGLDPDYKCSRRFKMNVEPIIDIITSKSDSTSLDGSANGSLSSSLGSAPRRALEDALAARHEAEAKVAHLEAKLKDITSKDALHNLNAGSLINIETKTASSSSSHPNIPQAPPLKSGNFIPLPPPPPPSSSSSSGPPPPPPPPGPPSLNRNAGKSSVVDASSSPKSQSLSQNGNIPNYLVPKRRYEPDKKLKRVNWTKIAPQKLTQDSFWSNIKEDELADPDLFKQITHKFAVGNNITTGRRNKNNLENSLSSSSLSSAQGCNDRSKENSNNKVKQLRVLDPKSAQNLSICLGSIKLPYESIRDLIWSMNSDQASPLSEEILQQLLKYMPEQFQIDLLSQKYSHVYESLNEAERFLITISPIKRIASRLKCICFKMKYSEMVNDIKPAIVAVSTSCEQIKKSKKFSKILQLILLIGNYMNSGSNNAQTYGFEMNFLTKIQSTKSEDQSTTLLQFLIQIIDNHFPEYKDFYLEISYVEKATKVCQENMSKTLNQMNSSLKLLQIEISNCAIDVSYDNIHDKFLENMKEFYGKADENYDIIKGMFEKMEAAYQDIGIYFCFDPKKCPFEDFFADIRCFVENFRKSQNENNKVKDAEEKARRTKEIKEKAETEKKEKNKRKVLVDMNSDGEHEGVMDSLLEALQSGSAFHKPTRRRLSRV
ncbi:protein diaphanous homolog 2-like isoform X1 [Gordionus sp. m RMFG-2023]|uniref:protein diaphanous homolog 2-like isoform X1 n=1 Tax=Gordionus sp. m RMFG-2023 TaxID=3053472 RepID=UPI0031FD5339